MLRAQLLILKANQGLSPRGRASREIEIIVGWVGIIAAHKSGREADGGATKAGKGKEDGEG